MLRIVIILAVICAMLAGWGGAVASAAEADGDFYVAPDGNDTWSGKLAARAVDGKDGPFATLARAQQAVRELKRREPGRTTPIRVIVRGGTYYLAHPLVFKPEDSGREGAPVVYEALAGETPVLSGGVRLTGWKLNAKGYWELRLPEVARGEWAFSQLFVDGQRRFRPRLPKGSYYTIAATVEPSQAAGGRGHDRFRYDEGDINPRWTNFGDVEVLAFHQWGMSRIGIGAVDEETRVVTLAAPTCNTSWWAAMPKGFRYIVENVPEALSEPGEWYLDRGTGVLTYIPMPGEDPAKAEVVAPRLERLVEMWGDADLGMTVDHIIFRGLTFSHTNWNLPPTGYSFPQAEAALGAAISAQGTRHCALERCVISHVGEYAVEWGMGCKHNRVQGCALVDLGAGGVKIGEQAFRPEGESLTSHQTVEDNLIAHGGRMHPAAVGVWIGHSPYNEVRNNEIRDFYYTGISVGWQWSYAPSQAHHNLIEYNEVGDIGQDVLSDMGGIYTLGPSPGSVIRGNRFHDVNCYSYGGWGIYFDQATTEMLAEGNLCFRCETGGFHQHFGKENRVVNNVFALAKTQQIIRSRAEEHMSFTFERNIVYWTEGKALGGNWTGANFLCDYNVYWDAAGDPVDLAGMTLEQWQAEGHDQHSVVADPLFVDPAKDDFRLRPESPALKLGFDPIALDKTGPRTPPPAAPERPVPRAYPPPPPPPPTRPVDEDFETAEVGSKPVDTQLFEESEDSVIRVTDETAATGKRSLKFTDVAGQEHSYAPHVVYNARYDKGVIEGSFDLRLEPGAVFYHEWRDWPGGAPYVVGPSLRIGQDRMLMANGLALAPMPEGKWLHFDLACGLGEQATGRYTLTVAAQSQEAPLVRQVEVPCEPKFKAMTWLGFVADGTDPGVFYLDNIKLEPRAE